MQLGISSYTFAWSIGVPGYIPAQPMTAFDLIDKAVDLGADCVQIADNMPLDSLSNDEKSRIKAYADERNIPIEVGTRGLHYANVEQYIDIALTMGSPILRIVIDIDDFRPDIPTILEILHDIEPQLRQANIQLAIENHDRFKAAEFKQIIEELDSRWIGSCLDSVNSLGAGEGVETVTNMLAPYTFNLHVKEYIIERVYHNMGFTVEGRPAGQGMLPLTWILQQLTAKCRSAVLEQWVPPEHHVQDTISKEHSWAEESMTFLQTIFKTGD